MPYFRSDLFDQRMAELGYRKETERARAIKTTRMSLYRLRKGYVRLDLDRAREIADITGLAVDDLFPRQRDGGA